VFGNLLPNTEIALSAALWVPHHLLIVMNVYDDRQIPFQGPVHDLIHACKEGGAIV
jgi:hypothetical protein